ncbi:MAG: Fe2+ or Zn2+ uptake regulation protein [Chloroflexi bacterium]|jgi:Fur family ferric uptake transcriptional regulator|nr:MAG: Fe2+ or Zn2+ uptake regulation protein [Chloroflexota bacterium]
MTNSNSNTTRPNLLALLEDHGLRITAPRQRIVDYIHAAPEGFTAEQMADDLLNVSRATVFRTLKILLKANVICRLSIPGGNPRYSLSRVDHHHHTVCVSCGRVGEFRASTVEKLLKGIESDIPGVIVDHNIEFYIKCDVCV